MAARKQIFRRGPSSFGLMIAVSVMSLALILTSTYTTLLQPARAFFVDLIAPFYGVTDIGNVASDWAEDNFASRDQLLQANRQLEDENLILQRRVNTMAAIQAENARLRQLLGTTEFIEERVLIVELVGTPPNAETHRVIINRGSSDGLAEGLPVVDANGLFGQIVSVGTDNSELLLISDRIHALPVEILRTGFRAIAEGTGDYQALRLRNIPETVDVHAGDEIVSSGLGGIFPYGYPVGRVESVEKNRSTPFLEIRVRPHAGLQTSRQMLVLFSQSKEIKSEPDAKARLNGSADEPMGEVSESGAAN